MPDLPITRDVVVIGGSAGAISVLQEVLANLPSDFQAAMLIVVHQSQTQPGRLPEVLGQRSKLPIAHAKDADPIELGRIYVAPPDYHMLIERGWIHLSRGPKENRFRPSVDPLFRTAARAYGPQVVGVILSGMLDDGTLGAMRIKQFGGTVIAQDPLDAESPDMPTSVIRNVDCDYVLKIRDIAGVLNRLAEEPIDAPVYGASAISTKPMPESSNVAREADDSADRGDAALVTGERLGLATGLTCPQCGGAVWESKHDGLVYYRCHVGHAYTADSMAAEHNSILESTLWEAVRMFQESAALNRRLERKAMEMGNGDMQGRYRERSEEAEQRAEVVRHILLNEIGLGSRTHAA
jgi:two-component system, chemotaxis family, protein-glutamate methylesterase/glutaminase